MPRKFKVAEKYKNGWYDTKSRQWFMPSKETIVEDTADFENINRYVIRGFLYEIKEEIKVKQPELVTKTTAQLLMEDKPINKTVVANIEDIDKKEVEVQTDDKREVQNKKEKGKRKVTEVISSNIVEDKGPKKRGPKKKAK